MSRPGLLLASVVFVAGCVGAPAAKDLGIEPAPLEVAASERWDNATFGGEFVGWAVPPLASGGYPESEPHAFVVDANETENATSLRFELHATPQDRAEFYVANPSCHAAEVSDCRGGTEQYFSDDYNSCEIPSPEEGTWRVVVYGSGAGAAQVQYSVMASAHYLPRAG